MEYFILVACVIAGVSFLLLFGQRRNKFEFIVSRVIEKYDESGVLVEGSVASGWIAVTQGVFLSQHKKSHYFTVVGIEKNENSTSKIQSGDMLRLMLSGSKIELIEKGTTLNTSKTEA